MGILKIDKLAGQLSIDELALYILITEFFSSENGVLFRSAGLMEFMKEVEEAKNG